MIWTPRQSRMLGTSDGVGASSAIATMQRKVWTQQPQGAASIDWSNPITRNLLWAYEGGVLAYSSPLSQQSVLGSGVTKTVGVSGRQLSFSGSQTTNSCHFGVWQGLSGAIATTVDIGVYFSGTPAGHFFGQWDNWQRWLLQANGTSLIWVPAQADNNTRSRYDVVGAFSGAGWYRITLSWESGGRYTQVVNGVVKGEGAASINVIGPSNSSEYLQLGIVSYGTALNGCISGARIWNRALSKQECLLLNKNPWQIFAPKSSPIWVPA